ncbi:hypothetical protein ONE63_005440 [Megalurothrips usitatus]|uniref:Tetraspanin n=1 Tax=Megalurothrips usitatus TaxID=439358 RepID=A0AAV7XXZ9_9NEOP|nr:hypothetical protein ONE63_005440 [Megalurothrips usitatus]
MSGILLVLTSVMVAEPLSQLTPLLEQQFLSPGLLLGGAGGAVMVVSCFGMWGALRQSTALVSLFSFLLAILLLLELGAGIMAFLMQDGLRQVLTHNIESAMLQYDSDPATKEAIDTMQTGLRCCGVNSPQDWSKAGYTFKLPSSCCTNGNGNVTTQDCTMDVEVRGCLPELGNLIIRGSAFIASTAVVTAFTQFLGILFACTLGRTIRRQKTLRDLRRHQLQDNLINSYSPVHTKPITITY